MGGGPEVPFPCLDREHLRAMTVPSPLTRDSKPQNGEVRKWPLCSVFSGWGRGASRVSPSLPLGGYGKQGPPLPSPPLPSPLKPFAPGTLKQPGVLGEGGSGREGAEGSLSPRLPSPPLPPLHSPWEQAGGRQPQAEFVTHFALGSSGGKIEALPLVQLSGEGERGWEAILAAESRGGQAGAWQAGRGKTAPLPSPLGFYVALQAQGKAQRLRWGLGPGGSKHLGASTWEEASTGLGSVSGS